PRVPRRTGGPGPLLRPASRTARCRSWLSRRGRGFRCRSSWVCLADSCLSHSWLRTIRLPTDNPVPLSGWIGGGIPDCVRDSRIRSQLSVAQVKVTVTPGGRQGAARDWRGPAGVIEFRGVSKRFADGTVAVDDLDLVAANGQITVLVGPSGCGKTTSLRMVNRMIDPTSGAI